MILDGKELKNILLEELKKEISDKNLNITLAIILVGDDEASKIYIRNKENACNYVGINVEKYLLDEKTNESEVIDLIKRLNDDANITGIILQSPVPSHIIFDKCIDVINAKKDVDGFSKENIYNLYLNRPSILPCTVKGIIYLLKHYNIDLVGANVVIVGRGSIVGRPLGLALLNEDATVTWTHSKTKDLKSITSNADILIVACGEAHLITADMVKEGAVIVDVGISKINGHIIGDVDFSNVKEKAKYITPNPGGVGPMTVTMIIDNLVMMKKEYE